MTVKLYYALFSPPARATLFAVKILNIPHQLQEVNMMKSEHRDSNYEEKNPQHTVPTLEDDGFVLWDSHAINAYLINQYAEDDSLYPKDPKKRALVDQRLHFDTGVLFPNIRTVTRAIVREQKLTSVTPAIIDSFEECYDFVEKFLKGSKYAAGENITIADFSFVPSLTTMDCLVPIKSEKYPLVGKYLELCRSTLQFYDEVNEGGLQEYRSLLKKFNFQSAS